MTASGCQAKWGEGYLLCKLSSGLLMYGVVGQVVAEIPGGMEICASNQCLQCLHPLDELTQPKAQGRLRMICLI